MLRSLSEDGRLAGVTDSLGTFRLYQIVDNMVDLKVAFQLQVSSSTFAIPVSMSNMPSKGLNPSKRSPLQYGTELVYGRGSQPREQPRLLQTPWAYCCFFPGRPHTLLFSPGRLQQHPVR